MNDTSSTPSATPIPNNYGVATSMADVQNQINEMEAFFETGANLPVDFRLRQLRRLQAYLLAHYSKSRNNFTFFLILHCSHHLFPVSLHRSYILRSFFHLPLLLRILP